MDAHELMVLLKALCSELGRTPTRDEFNDRLTGSRDKVIKAFGSWTAMLKAAGLEGHHPRKRERIPFMRRDIVEHLEQVRQVPAPSIAPLAAPVVCTKRILAVGDLHYPFVDLKAVAWAVGLAKELQPDLIVQVGDAYDMLSWGSFPKSANYFTPKQEIETAFEGLSQFWKDMQAAAPRAQCVLMHGNHTIRPFRQLLDKAPALEVFLSVRRWFDFPGVRFIEDHREEFTVEGISFLHGYRSKLGDHRDYMLTNCVTGHTHRGGVVFKQIRGTQLWELNCGYLGDPQSKGFTYTPQKTVEWTQGIGFIDHLGPRFIPYPSG